MGRMKKIRAKAFLSTENSELASNEDFVSARRPFCQMSTLRLHLFHMNTPPVPNSQKYLFLVRNGSRKAGYVRTCMDDTVL